MDTITPGAVPEEVLATLTAESEIPAPAAPAILTDAPEQPNAIPEKFRGKGLNEVVESYQNLESEFGRTKQENQELRQKAAEFDRINQELWRTQNQPPPNNVIDPTEAEEAEFAKLWERDPAAATQARVRLTEKKTQYAIQDFEARQFYNAARQQLPGFVELEPRMKELLQDYAPIIKPDQIMTPKVILALYNQARSETLDAKMNEAKRVGAQEAENLRREKHSAFAEGSSITGSAPQDFAKKSLADMQRELGYVAQD